MRFRHPSISEMGEVGDSPGNRGILCLGGGFRLVEEHLTKSSLPPWRVGGFVS